MSIENQSPRKEAKNLPFEQRLVHDNPLVRIDANIDLAALCSSNPNDPRIRETGHIFINTVADSNAAVQDKALDALIAYLQAADADSAIRYAEEVCDAVAAKCLTGRPKTVDKAKTVFMLLVELGAAETFLDAMEKAIKNNVAKSILPVVYVLLQALRKFGSIVLPAKRMLKILPKLFDLQDQKVRASSKTLTLELCHWIGKERLKSALFGKLTNTMRKELEAEFVNVTGSGSAERSRKIRSKQEKKPKKEVEEKAAGPGSSEEAAAETPLNYEEYKLFDPVDILRPLEKAGFWNGVKATKWSEREDAVADLTKLASTKRIAPGDYSEVCRTLKKLIMDANINVRVEAVKAVEKLALGLRSDFSKYALYLVPVLLETLKERRHLMRKALTNTLQAIHKAGCVTLADIVEDIRAAVKSEFPLVRSLTLNWVTHCIETSNKDLILKVHKEYVPICMECLHDWIPSAFSVLLALAKLVGMSALEKSLEKLDNVQKEVLIKVSRSGPSTVTGSGASLSGTSQSAKEKKDDSMLFLTDKSRVFILPRFINKYLMPHQAEGIDWLWSQHSRNVGGLLGDDMGVGKTRQITAFIAGLFESDLINKVLLVCPNTLLHQWSKEFLKMGLPRPNIYHGVKKTTELELVQQKSKGILLTTYGMINVDSGKLLSLNLNYIILDEGQKIKNLKSQVSRNIQKIPSPHRILLSGTPMQNEYKELWALFNFCVPEVFDYHTIDIFKNNVEAPLVKGLSKGGGAKQQQLLFNAKHVLDRLIEPYFLRRTKDEVFTNGEIPKKGELVVWLDMSASQKKLYQSFLESKVFIEARSSVPLAALTILRKLCSHPDLNKRSEPLKEKKKETSDDQHKHKHAARNLALMMSQMTKICAENSTSCKIMFVESLVGKLVKEKHRILIFTEWQMMIDILEENLKSKHITCLHLDGRCSFEERKNNIKAFQLGKADVFLLTSSVGGVGLTLTTADRVILIDSSWNPSIDSQSVDRAYRLGQKKNVIVYRILTCGTIEEVVYKTQINKTSIINSAMSSELRFSYFSEKEIKGCFELTDFKISSSVKELLKEQKHKWKKTDPLFKHVQDLKSLPNMEAVLNHSLAFPNPVIRKPTGNDAVKKNTRKITTNLYAEICKDALGRPP